MAQLAWKHDIISPSALIKSNKLCNKSARAAAAKSSCHLTNARPLEKRIRVSLLRQKIKEIIAHWNGSFQENTNKNNATKHKSLHDVAGRSHGCDHAVVPATTNAVPQSSATCAAIRSLPFSEKPDPEQNFKRKTHTINPSPGKPSPPDTQKLWFDAASECEDLTRTKGRATNRRR